MYFYSLTPMKDKRLKIWFFKTESFTRLRPSLSSFFDCDFEQDYENVWEWMEGYSNQYQVTVNIGRAHENWQHDQFMNPVMILLNPADLNFNSLALIKTISSDLFSLMGVEIYYGYLTITADDKYEYLELAKIMNMS